MDNIKTFKYKKLVLSGGEIKGLTYIGVLKYLEETNIINEITEFVGCSIGAFSCLLFVLGYKYKNLKKIFNEYNFEDLKDVKITTFFNKYGLDDGRIVSIFIKTFIRNAGLDENITMIELYNINKKILVSTVTNVNTNKTEFISKDTYPNMPVHIAIRMSMAIPFIFTPIKYNQYYYVDGAVSCNFPIKFYTNLQGQDYSDILAIALKSTSSEYINNDINSIDSYIFNIFKTTFNTIENKDIDNSKTNGINTLIIYTNRTSNYSFDISITEKKKLYKIGYKAISCFIHL